MGYSLGIEAEQTSGRWALTVRVRLSRTENNALFLAGDALVSWPAEGLEATGDPRLERSAMFVSAIAAMPDGLRLTYAEKDQAERAAAIVQAQFAATEIEREN